MRRTLRVPGIPAAWCPPETRWGHSAMDWEPVHRTAAPGGVHHCCARAMSAVPGKTAGPPARAGAGAAAVVRRSAAWAILGVSTFCWVVVMVVGLPNYPLYLLPWMLVYAASVAVTAVILVRVPSHPLGLWLAVGSLITAQDAPPPVLERQLASDAPAGSIALTNLVLQWISLLP